MEKDIFTIFENTNISKIILTEKVHNEYNDLFINRDLNVVADARSATFFAIGYINITANPTVLVVDKDELSSTLTGVTEANYQYLPLIVISMGSDVASKDSFKYVTQKILLFDHYDKKVLKNEIRNYINDKSHRPLLIYLNSYKKQQDFTGLQHYEKVVNAILNANIKNEQIFIQYNLNKNLIYKAKQNETEIVYRCCSYGVLSYFFGRAITTMGNKINIMITDYENLVNDINSLSLRYINTNIIIVYLKDKNINQCFDNWVKTNGFVLENVSNEYDLCKTISTKNDKPLIIEYLV